MNAHFSTDSSIVNNIDENKNIKNNEIYDNADDNAAYEDKHMSNNQGCYLSSTILPKHEQSCRFLSIHTQDDLCQDNYYQEKLLPLDIFKLGGYNLLSKTNRFDNNKPDSLYAAKHTLIEDEQLSTEPHPKRIDIKILTDDEKTHASASPDFTEQAIKDSSMEHIEQTAQTYPISNENSIKKDIGLKSYARSSLCNTKYYPRTLYRDAIKQIDIDSNGLFKKYVLEKMAKDLKRRNLLESSIDLSATYSNIRRYTLDKLSSLLNDDLIDSDVLITPGMSISDLRLTFISNKYFFKKLRDNCNQIAEDTRATPSDCLSHVFQCRIIFNISNHLNSANTRVKFYPQKNKFLQELKELIIDTISNLPNNIIYAIKNINQRNIVNALFSKIHGVLISKLLIKNLKSLPNNENKFSGRFHDNLNLLNDFLAKIGNLVRVSCIFHDGVFLPNESTVEKLSKYILSDMYGIPSVVHKSLNLCDESIHKSQGSSCNIELPSESMDPKREKTRNDCEHAQVKTTSLIKNTHQSKQHIITKELNMRYYYKINLFTADLTTIYETAIKKINIDNNKTFRNSLLKKIGSYIASKGIIESSINLSRTYSNVCRYVLDKVSPYISNIITTTDTLITPGMSLSSIKNNCISNKSFFEKLNKKCEEIVESINVIPDYYFSIIIQNYICDSNKSLKISQKKTKLYPEIKSLITETISNLPNNIIHELKKFNQSETVNGLFLDIHSVYAQKSLIRNALLLFNYNKLPNNDPIANLDLLNNLHTKLLNQVILSPILHEGKIFFPGESTAKLLSKYLLLDMYNIPFKFHKKLVPYKHISDNILMNDCEKNSTTLINTSDNIESASLAKPVLIPHKSSKWNPDLISSSIIYEEALSLADIDKGDFENSFVDKIKNYSTVKRYSIKKEEINVDLSITYYRIKNYISKILQPFFKKIEERIKPVCNMTMDEYRLSYISNEEFFDKLRKFCTKTVTGIKNISDSKLNDMIQNSVRLEIKEFKTIIIRSRRKILFRSDLEKLLTRNIMNVPEMIANAIKLIPLDKFLEKQFTRFDNMYVDNSSLLKSKSVFSYVQKKVTNDHLLNVLVDKISIEMIDKAGKGNSIKGTVMRKIINSYMVCNKLSTYKYIRRLIREDLPTLDKIVDNIMIIRNDKIEIADQETKCKILDKLESHLIQAAIRSYNESCVKKYKSHKSRV
ncbi:MULTISPECIES: hypothetical protein [Candidatus Ichthyocystis]|uniref:Uncharacterized protein n=1 Tax=Candidatus Ichthyocystis hellenicum TaxID=1561003 RepID=A0A0S4M5R9_9BURK|nr:MULTISPECIES: hypothetical protein [Ichthyocystis]CUT18274.1 hypothetical protein Ark11_1476 [Candidatus Ichthyocystis hellenicum]